LVESMFNSGLVGADDAHNAYEKMITDGSRLPIKEIEKQLNKFGHSR